MKRVTIALLAVVYLATLAGAAPVHPAPKMKPQYGPMVADTLADSAKSVQKTPPKSAELSTALAGSDSLGLLPKDVETPYAGGTRRVRLESTIFRREEPIAYNSAGRRDPFRALIVDEKKEGEVDTDLLRLENAVLSGVVWSMGQYMAMVKDKDGKTFFLREGDAVFQGRVLSVTQSNATFEVTDFGDYDRVTLKVKG
jgi:hypothetical protein